jgi:hypothetical protein
MSRNGSASFAWLLCVIGTALVVYSLAASFRAAGAPADAFAIADRLLIGADTIVFGVIGALIVSRQPRNTIGWLLMVMHLSIAILAAIIGFGEQPAASPAQPTPADFIIAWLNSWTWWLLIGPLLLIPVLFPTGRPPSPRWRWVIVSLASCFLLFLTLVTFSETFEFRVAPLRNPIGFIPQPILDLLLFAFLPFLLLNVGLCVAAIFVRYRRAQLLERQQIKWLLWACALFAIVYIGSSFGNSEEVGPRTLLFDLAILGIPISIGIAILRHRLWDIDLLIRRTVIYTVLTGLLALTYLGSVVVLQNIFSRFTGQQQSTLGIVISTLIIAALFVPLQRRVQAIIDQRFYRRKYNASRLLDAFGATLRDDAGGDLQVLVRRLLAAVEESLEPEHASLWLRAQAGATSDSPAWPSNR